MKVNDTGHKKDNVIKKMNLTFDFLINYIISESALYTQ